MKSEKTSPGETGDSQRLALAGVGGELLAAIARIEGLITVMEKDVETCPISKRRGRWIERNVARWIVEVRAHFAGMHKRYRVRLWLSGVGARLRALEARQVAALERLAARAAEERAKGWPLKTLHDVGRKPEL
jgi:hypothetical protein